MCKNLSEVERAAARAIGKALVKELSLMEWHRKGNEAECAKRTAEAIARRANESGIPAIWLKSYMVRIQAGSI